MYSQNSSKNRASGTLDWQMNLMEVMAMLLPRVREILRITYLSKVYMMLVLSDSSFVTFVDVLILKVEDGVGETATGRLVILYRVP